MADLTRDSYFLLRFPATTHQEVYQVDTSVAQTIYKGQPMIIDQDVDNLNLTPFTSSVTLATGDVFVGFAAFGKKIDAGTREDSVDASIEVVTSGEIGFKSGVFTNSDIGKAVYMEDSGTFTLTSTANLKVGVLRRVIDGVAYIDIGAAGNPTVQA